MDTPDGFCLGRLRFIRLPPARLSLQRSLLKKPQTLAGAFSPTLYSTGASVTDAATRLQSSSPSAQRTITAPTSSSTRSRVRPLLFRFHSVLLSLSSALTRLDGDSRLERTRCDYAWTRSGCSIPAGNPVFWSSRRRLWSDPILVDPLRFLAFARPGAEAQDRDHLFASLFGRDDTRHRLLLVRPVAAGRCRQNSVATSLPPDPNRARGHWRG